MKRSFIEREIYLRYQVELLGRTIFKSDPSHEAVDK